MGQETINSLSARQFWSQFLSKSYTQNSFFYSSGLVKKGGEGSQGAAIIEMNELITPKGGGKASGYQITYDLEGPALQFPTAGDNPIKGKEGKLSLYSDTIQINQDRMAVIDDGKFADGLVPYEYRARARERFSSQMWPIYFDERIIAKASGVLGDGTWLTIDTTQPVTNARNRNGSAASDGNNLRAPTTTANASRIIFGNGKSNQAGLATTDKLSLDIIDAAILQAMRTDLNTAYNRLMPTLKLNGKDAFVFMADYTAITDLNQNSADRFYDLERAKIQGGKEMSALLNFTRYVYNSPMGVDVYIVPHPRMVKFSATTTGSVKACRNLLLGHSALRVAYGRESKDLPSFSWHEETDDRGNQLVITTGVTCGIQKCAFNTDSTDSGTTLQDWAVIAVDTYSNW